MSKKVNNIINICIVLLLFSTTVFAGETQWIAVGDLHTWFHSAGCEVETGRTGETADQLDGLRWPAQFRYQDSQAAKALWIGCTNFNDPVANKTFAHKVVHVGPRNPVDEVNEFMTEKFLLHGKFNHPTVYVDKTPSSKLDFMETVNGDIDITLQADRVLENVVHTSLGLTMTRTIYAFTRKDHNNYFIYDYVYENTGIIDAAGSQNPQTLENVVFYYQYRYAPSREGSSYGNNWLPQSATWGRNTMNDFIYTHPETGEPFRASISWHGRHSQWAGDGDNIGGPAYNSDGHLGAAQFVGTLTLHADKTSQDPSDDTNQPLTTWEMDSDDPLNNSGRNQYASGDMTAEYQVMISGRPEQSHAERVGDGFADQYGSAGGMSAVIHPLHDLSQYLAAGRLSIAIDDSSSGPNPSSILVISSLLSINPTPAEISISRYIKRI